MTVAVQILIPNVIQSMNEVYLRGVYSEDFSKGLVIINFTVFDVDIKVLHNNKKINTKYIYGYYNRYKDEEFDKSKFYNLLTFSSDLKKGLKTLVVEGKVINDPNLNCVLIFYDINTMRHSENLSLVPGDDTFSLLHKTIQEEQNKLVCTSENMFKPVFKKPSWLSSTMIGQYILNYVDLLNWLYHGIKGDQKISIKQGNLLLAIAMDILLGYLMLNLFTINRDYLSSSLMEALDMLVKYLFSLLEWLMDAPAGLKLNNAFNKMLGKFFSYHIQLWWIFLEVSSAKLDIILDTYHCLGYLGFTFQAAMISDLICVVTFHSYCIYTYVARLFNIQISGLIALMRLFVGRKYNPLRKCIDSCEYTNQELFVGTVAFTILLFLLPITTMYYVVFTLLRLLSLFIQYILTKLIYLIQTLPLYVIILWLIKSHKVAGKVTIEVLKQVENEPLILKLNVNTKPLGTLLRSTRPPVLAQSPLEWSSLLSNLLRGKQITCVYHASHVGGEIKR